MTKNTKLLIALIALLFVTSTALFTVQETEQVGVVRFGKVERIVHEPGLNVKIPFIEKLTHIDKRWLEWDGEAKQFTTRDKRFIFIDVFARWRIVDPLLFIKSLRNEQNAQKRLDDFIDGATRNIVANHNLIEAIRTTDREFAARETSSFLHDDTVPIPAAVVDAVVDDDAAAPNAPAGQEEVVAAKQQPEPILATPVPGRQMGDDSDNYAIDVGREQLTRLILEKVSEKAMELGIEVKDVQIKRINYIPTVRAKVFDRMTSERKRVAEGFRSRGRGLSAEINGKMDKELKKITSEAYRQSEEIRGEADAEAASVYARAYKTDPEFYAFLKTMESYQVTIDENSWMLFSTDADYAKRLSKMKGN